jgi:beta-alanine degradation protein BauB
MKGSLKLLAGGLFLSVLLLGAGKMAMADDPLTVGPDIYKLLFENDRVRVMQVTFAPGAKIAMHSHPDHVTTIISGGTLKLSYLDGSSKELAGKPGDAVWIPAEAHAAENIGTTEVVAVVTELKELAPAAPSSTQASNK